jgi:acyl-CoA thioester hydrolase
MEVESSHTLPASHFVRVYYEDTDSYGIVYYANYLKFLERGRTEWMRALGYDQNTLQQELNLLFPVRSVKIDYLKPARFDDGLNVFTRFLKRSGARLVFEQWIEPAEETEPAEPAEQNGEPAQSGAARERVKAKMKEKICHAFIEVVPTHADTFKPRRVTQAMLDSFTHGVQG